jgi:hypothetical protein
VHISRFSAHQSYHQYRDSYIYTLLYRQEGGGCCPSGLATRTWMSYVKSKVSQRSESGSSALPPKSRTSYAAASSTAPLSSASSAPHRPPPRPHPPTCRARTRRTAAVLFLSTWADGGGVAVLEGGPNRMGRRGGIIPNPPQTSGWVGWATP